MSPIAETLTSEVIHDINTFLGWTKKLSNLPFMIVSDNENALLKKKRETPYVADANPQSNTTSLRA